MLTLTSQQTVVEWENFWFAEPQFEAADIERVAKLDEMMVDGKIVAPVITVTPESRAPGDSTTSIMLVGNWVDRAAAEEYIAFIEALAKKYSLPLISIKLKDVTPAEVALVNASI